MKRVKIDRADACDSVRVLSLITDSTTQHKKAASVACSHGGFSSRLRLPPCGETSQ